MRQTEQTGSSGTGKALREEEREEKIGQFKSVLEENQTSPQQLPRGEGRKKFGGLAKQSKETKVARFGMGHVLAAQESLGTSNTLIRCIIIVDAVRRPTES